MKKTIVVAALAVLMAVLLFVGIAFNGGQAEQAPTTEPVETTEEMTTEATEEMTIPGLEDSDFDDEPEETVKATEETKPKNQSGSDSNKPAKPKPTEPKPTEPKPTEHKPTEPEPVDPKPDTPKPDNPRPTEPKPTEPKPTEPKPTEPKPTEPKPTEPKPTEPKPTEGDAVTEYEWFQSLSPSAQQKHMESFANIDAFFEWYNAAREAYEKANPPIEVGSGSIDIGAIIEGKN